MNDKKYRKNVGLCKTRHFAQNLKILAKVVKPNLQTILSIFILILISNNICFAGVVPKFNPKNPNQKPGLYRLQDMNHCYDGGVGGHFIDNSKIIFFTPNYSNSRHIDILDLKTFKFSKLPELKKHLIEKVCGVRTIISDGDNLYVLAGKILTKEEQYLFKYNLASKKCEDLDFYLDKDCYQIYKQGDDINLFCTSNTMYKYNLKTKNISDAYSSDSIEYKTIKEKAEKQNISYKNIPFIDNINYKMLNEKDEFKKKIVVKRDEVDYGVSVESVIHTNRYPSWFSPLYEYDVETKELKPLNEFVRSYLPNYIKIPNKNMVLIVGGSTSIYPSFHNADPKDVPLVKRINGPTDPSNRAYIYIYKKIIGVNNYDFRKMQIIVN